MENINVGQGISKDDDPFEAGKQAAKQAMEEYDGEETPDIGFIFCSGSKYGKNDETIEKFVEGADEGFGDVEWVGCTSAGEISKEGLTKKSAVATVIQSDMMYWGIHAEEIDPDDPKESGKKAAKGALNNLDIDKMVHSYSQYQFLKKADTSEMVTSDPYNMIVLAQGPGVDAGEYGTSVSLIKGVKEVIGNNPVVGGLSGDDKRGKKNYQFYNGEVYGDFIISVGIVTSLKTDFRMSHGYKPTDKVALVTESDSNKLIKLNGSPAATYYAEEMLEIDFNEMIPKSIEWADNLGLKNALTKMLSKVGKSVVEENPILDVSLENPLGFSDSDGNFWLKTIFDVEKKNLVSLNEIPQDSALVLMESSPEKVYETSESSIKNLIEEISKEGMLLAFECIGRQILFEDSVEEASEEYVTDEDVTPLGFVTYGEFGTQENGNTGGQTLTLCSMGIGNEVLSEE